MNTHSILSKLFNEGYGKSVSEYSKKLGNSLWTDDQGKILVFENGIRYQDTNNLIEINYDEITGIKSAMTIKKLSQAQSEEVDNLVMRFECNSYIHDLLFPIEIYSSLLGYFCEQVKQSQNVKVSTGFLA